MSTLVKVVYTINVMFLAIRSKFEETHTHTPNDQQPVVSRTDFLPTLHVNINFVPQS